MIGEIIKKKSERGSGAGPEAFAPGVGYVCGKADSIELRNLSSSDWLNAADEMVLTSEMSDRVKKPYYHVVISWHEHEQPSEDQMIDAADKMIAGLGLDDHQVVIGTHGDTPRKHVHLVINTVNPLTGLTWSKSQDMMKIEATCRQIELDQGWSHDRGRFDFDVTEIDGQEIATLKPNPEAWAKKTEDRKEGKRPKSAREIQREKATGFESFDQGIPAALKEKCGQIIGAAIDWQQVHHDLGEIGLTYYKAGSGARIGIIGSDEYAKASSFGSKFSVSKMEKLFGPIEEPEREYRNEIKDNPKQTESISGLVSEDDIKATKSDAFKITLLRRIYTDIHIDPLISRAIRFVDLADNPAQITFKSGATVVDNGDNLSTSESTEETRATMIAIAKAKGWSSIRPTGSPDYVLAISLEAARSGLPVHGVPDDVQAMADHIIEQGEKARRRIDIEASGLTKGHQESLVDRKDALDKNDTERAETRAVIDGVTAEAQAVMDAIGDDRDPLSTAFRAVIKEQIKTTPDARKVENPVPSSSMAVRDPDGKRHIKGRVLENDRSEIDAMKAVDISVIAGLGGWSDVSGTHEDSSDKSGKKYRIYQTGNDTIKATLKDGIWLWTSNKTGESGSVIDLWQSDNPTKNIGHARSAFREIMGTEIRAAPAPARSDPQEEDHTAARRRWQDAPYIEGRRSYAEDRGIDKKTIERFSDQIRSGAFGGVYFAHQNDHGDIVGFEQRWEKDGEKNKARFAKGGRKTVSILGDPDTASRMVVLEGGLDSLALAEIEDRTDTIYVSTGGGFGSHTEEALKRLAIGRTVVGGFDNDSAGASMHKTLISLIEKVERLEPPSNVEGSEKVCHDWLDVLNAAKEDPEMKIDTKTTEVMADVEDQHENNSPGYE